MSDRDLVESLRSFVFGDRYERDHADLPKQLSGTDHAPRQGASWSDAARSSYRNMRNLAATTGKPSEVVRDVHRLCALNEWLGIVDPAAAGMMGVHYNLCSASLTALAQRPEYVADLLADLDAMRTVGLFMATEGSSGNNLAAIRTEARYDQARDEFVITSPDPGAHKIMSTTGLPGIARTGVVVAQLHVPGRAPSLHAFAVPLTSEDGPLPGVTVSPLSRGMTLDMDFARTSFDNVRVPRHRWLAGPAAGDRDHDPLTATDDFGTRFWQTLDCLKLGRVLLSSTALAQARAALTVAVRYSVRRPTHGGGTTFVPAMVHRNHRASLMATLSAVYAATALMNAVKNRWADGLAEPERTLVANTVKLHASSTALDTVSTCRERCGAHGLLLQNRISEYMGFAHGTVTAEGDNQVIALALARRLMAGQPATAPEESRQPLLRDGGGFRLDGIGALLGLRTELLLAQARAMAGQEGRGSRFETWNACSGVARDAAFAHCEAEGYRSMLDGVSRGETPEARAALESLTLHHGLGLLARHGDWHLAEQLITPSQWRLVHAGIEEGDLDLARYGTALVDAFGIDDDLLQVPIVHPGGHPGAHPECTPGGEQPGPEQYARSGAAEEPVPC
ncbi:acyl-CoA dehydrogenase [Streptomyces sp. NPDC058613]|uniref:acyl-CoA dehydrogenase family protein n=1 Tax=Streptomyces sp. NPDC058613 TaxID=3346556 RepID=UPI00364E0B6D